MSGGAANKRRGTAYETLLVKHFREHGFDAERNTLSGTVDEGDLTVRVGDRRFIGEAKSGKNVRPRHWYESEAVPEAKAYGEKRGLANPAIPFVSMKTHGKAAGKSLVLISLDDFTMLLKEAFQ